MTGAFAHNPTRARTIDGSIFAARAGFDEKVERGASDQCWPWRGPISTTGYGKFSNAGRIYIASRLAAFFAGMPVNDAEAVCHTCDNRRCCNPAHLFVGSHADNQRDKVAKGRHPDRRGGNNPAAKLTVDQVRAIRASTKSYSAVAAEFGIKSLATIHAIKHRKLWGHV